MSERLIKRERTQKSLNLFCLCFNARNHHVPLLSSLSPSLCPHHHHHHHHHSSFLLTPQPPLEPKPTTIIIITSSSSSHHHRHGTNQAQQHLHPTTLMCFCFSSCCLTSTKKKHTNKRKPTSSSLSAILLLLSTQETLLSLFLGNQAFWSDHWLTCFVKQVDFSALLYVLLPFYFVNPFSSCGCLFLSCLHS